MKMRTFKYGPHGKLCRDKTVERHEANSSTTDWHKLNDAEYNKQLRLKLLEEAEEVMATKSNEELASELADVLEILEALCVSNSLSWDMVLATKAKKLVDRGGFEGRVFITKASHPEDSRVAIHCLNNPEKYPEIIEQD